MRRTKPLLQLAVTTLGAAGLMACAPTLPDLAIEQQWSDAMKRQSMFAIFPLDEDVMVGDVFLNTRGIPSASDDGNFDLVRIARTPAAEVARGLCESAKDRLFVAVAPTREETAKNAQGPQRDAAAGAAAARNPGPSTCEMVTSLPRGKPLPASIRLNEASVAESDFRLGHARIPSLTVARLTEAQVGGSGTLGNFGANLGIGGGGAVSLTIELKALQQLQIEQPVAFQMLRRLVMADTAVRPDAVVRIMAQRWPEGTQHLCRGDFEHLRDKMDIAIVTRVLYASEIDYQFSRSAETALRVALQATSVLEGQSQNPSVPEMPQKNSSARAPATNATELRDRLNAVLSGLAGGPTGTAAGGNATIAIGSLGGSTLKASFPRPLAVGAGASLVYPAHTALLPQNEEDVADVMAFCLDLLAGDRPDARQTAQKPAQWCPAAPTPSAPDTRGPLHAHLCRALAARQAALRVAVPGDRQVPPLPGFVPTGRSVTGRARLG